MKLINIYLDNSASLDDDAHVTCYRADDSCQITIQKIAEHYLSQSKHGNEVIISVDENHSEFVIDFGYRSDLYYVRVEDLNDIEDITPVLS